MVTQCAQQVLCVIVVFVIISLTDGVQIAYYSLFEVLFEVYLGGLQAFIFQCVVALAEELILVSAELQPVQLAKLLLLEHQSQIGIQLDIEVRIVKIL